MRRIIVLVALSVLLPPVAFAKTTPSYAQAKLLSMESVNCGYQQKSDKNLASELIGTDSDHSKTEQLLCQQYTLQTDELVYRVRPKDTKHLVLLPIGGTIDFRIDKNKMYVRSTATDAKEHEYEVVSVEIRSDAGAPKGNR
jgi:hypothetical protein